MKETLDTDITIEAPAHTVWAILDDIARYPEWNPLVPELGGRTTVDQQVEGVLTREGMPTVPLKPTLTAIVGARELRWLSERPTPGEFRAEHYFVLDKTNDDITNLTHNEDFAGTFLEQVWEPINTLGRAAYEKMNEALKLRAESYASEKPALHPAVDGGSYASESLVGQTLRCGCACAQVEVKINGPVYHNHLCGCSKCWKPAEALLAMIAVVSGGNLEVTSGGEKLAAVDGDQKIVRYACRDCGTHMYGRVDDADHHFYGLDFIHPELVDGPAPRPEFAGFVSSLVETGTEPARMGAIRAQLSDAGIPSYDAFSPEIMDMIAWHKVKLAES
ncbi:SRPBCC family protein [Leisingera sp. ANG59]|uniref:GFA family protein n=1 Tax=Leisingera sp. ANG59 TaxID=2675221 RepID=UPI00157228BC|nr:SRPBCC family protein [Leisingera sp. ANG59]NSY39357.1 glutathione-dependent formaldehyde-activating protein [Leisingera sp. ANG59]